MSALTDAIQQAIENPPRFYAGDRVQVRGNIEGQNKATVIEGPVTRIWFGKPTETYLIALDHNCYETKDGLKQVESWYDAKLLTRIVGCPCSEGCEAKEGEPHA